MNVRRDDKGMSLVELMVAIAISGLFLGLLAALFANGVNAQAQATERDLATVRAGVVSDSILSSIRDSSGFVIVANNRALISKVVDSSGTTTCRAWLVLAAGDAEYREIATDPAYRTGDIIYKESTSAIALDNRIGWSQLIERGAGGGDGVAGALRVRSGNNVDGSPRFVMVDADGNGSADAFSRSGSTLSVGLEVTLGESTVPVTNGVTMQAKSSGTDTTCW
jgi:prepilin-type N-terminal cleavage/methylation domain-containing protein